MELGLVIRNEHLFGDLLYSSFASLVILIFSFISTMKRKFRKSDPDKVTVRILIKHCFENVQQHTVNLLYTALSK